MGLGHTLMEHYIFDDEGRIRNLGAIDYRIPTSMDLPKLDGERRSSRTATGPGPYGAKGMSEGALLLRRAGRRRGRPRRDRRRASATCRCRPSGSGGRSATEAAESRP